ncbi:phage tail assembly protein [Maridesulfovibrio sp.]|uniref:phage tail assembly protein n=1 Tax=Maridesulfovibrio sp. TaxID=2795000 RepID=UPI002A18817F|nr:phage tail assembly protein [Maridesulfovibrio sp.]
MEPITLDYPVDFGGVEIKELNMRRAKVRDQKAARKSTKNDADYESVLFANLCEVSPDLIDDLDMKDYKKLQEKYKGFLS